MQETSLKYVIVSPVRDEEEHIKDLVASVASQTIRPVEWVIVNDGSTDNTGPVLDRCAEEFPWIRVVHRANRGFRKPGSGVVQAFYDGYNALRDSNWDFIVKLDGDLSFTPEYFEKCLEHFLNDPNLGIGGGDIYHSISGKMVLERNPRFHVRGATKIYRKACWEVIGGLWSAAGWDTIDEVKANMLGWRTYSFADLHLHHHRLTGSSGGFLRDRLKNGEVCYISGYHPLFVLASCVYRFAQKPFIFGSLATLYGYLRAHWRHVPRVEDRPYLAYIRSQQLRRLFGLQTIWR